MEKEKFPYWTTPVEPFKLCVQYCLGTSQTLIALSQPPGRTKGRNEAGTKRQPNREVLASRPVLAAEESTLGWGERRISSFLLSPMETTYSLWTDASRTCSQQCGARVKGHAGHGGCVHSLPCACAFIFWPVPLLQQHRLASSHKDLTWGEITRGNGGNRLASKENHTVV